MRFLLSSDVTWLMLVADYRRFAIAYRCSLKGECLTLVARHQRTVRNISDEHYGRSLEPFQAVCGKLCAVR
jgi:hypothetical protein